MDERIYSKDIIEFVTVGAEYCAFLERTPELEKDEFIDKIIKILPLLYLKATLLSPEEPEEEAYTERFVTESMYESVRMSIESLLGEDDNYLEVFQSGMEYSEGPLAASISEGLADIYQDLKDFISVYRLGNEPQMLESLYICYENFVSYWGQQLVNVLRALHHVKYSQHDDDDDDTCDCGHHHHRSTADDHYTDIFGHQQGDDDIFDKLNDNVD
ncbi:DUF5063 domain-containing protein [uncultured Barnesiella sp.]|uniref:DUF5063 domain-containing protein n=1 Tax=uncultured Barnesiella sp. TaxID=584861 RepID=UPI002603D1B4|nr:DUF5063 domain-containing protein [uncultured Barnesiella sp.]